MEYKRSRSSAITGGFEYLLFDRDDSALIDSVNEACHPMVDRRTKRSMRPTNSTVGTDRAKQSRSNGNV
ncbi:hypothetical protein BRC68_04490 [Halobacteriales archaeon QH_6_64_20]|nr:MAG: hypothetical protein BRC68_04490 [Halobacteriales archaeon QH_6_64_20]